MAEAYSARGHLKFREGNWEGAERDFQQSINFNPNYPWAHHFYSTLLEKSARFNEAMHHREEAARLDPLSVFFNTTLGWPYYYTHQYDKAIAQFQRALELEPNYNLALYNLGMCYLQKDNYAEAIAYFEKTILIYGKTMPLFQAYLGNACARAGKKDETMQILDELLEQASQGAQVEWPIAVIYCGLGEVGKAVSWLRKDQKRKKLPVPDIYFAPVFDNVRSHPQFIALLKEMGFNE